MIAVGVECIVRSRELYKHKLLKLIELLIVWSLIVFSESQSVIAKNADTMGLHALSEFLLKSYTLMTEIVHFMR